MAFILWFQKKLVWFIITILVAVLLLYQFCGPGVGRENLLLLQSTQEKLKYVKVELDELRQNSRKSCGKWKPQIFVITPTYTRYTQQADLIQLSNTLKHVPCVHWIVIEDSAKRTYLVKYVLSNSKIMHTHLNIKTQKDLARKKDDPRWKKHRGVDQRNLALRWIRRNIASNTQGVFYFADDDNTYHLDLFEEMRWTKQISIWPVAIVGGLKWEGPVCKNNKVISFHTAWMKTRKFPVDMAAFAIHLRFLFDYENAYINAEAKRGWLETDFLQQFNFQVDQLEPKADDCSRILVWHTQTAEPNMKEEIRLMERGQGSNPNIII